MKTYNITKLFLTLCTCVFATLAMAQVNQSDRQELVDFYNASCGDDCTLNWDFNQPVSTWEGITLNDDGRVIEIILSAKGLTGNIPDFDLPYLREINLRPNNLTGNIPDFSNVPNLEKLSLAYNQLIGEIPDFSNLPKLKRLSLTRNKLSGNIPNFSNLSQLEYLHLPENNLSGNIPDFNLPNVVMLELSHNKLSGTIPDFSGLPALGHVYMMYNNLTGEIPNFSNLPEITFINLEGNELSGNIPSFDQTPKLTQLFLRYNELSGTIPPFDNLSNLEIMDFAKNQLSGSIPALNHLTKLLLIDLQDNALSGSIPDLDSLTKLSHLTLNNNKLTGSVPDLSHINGLNKFHIQKNQFSHTDIATKFSENNRNDFRYSPQYHGGPQFHTNLPGDLLTIKPRPAIPTNNDYPVVKWSRFGNYQLNDTTYTFPSIDTSDIGIYKYFFKYENLIPVVKFESRPIYVYIEGLDLSGEPVIPGQLIIDYGVGRPDDEVDSLRNDLIDNYGGKILKSCGCSVKVDLWEFPDFIDEVREDLDIDGNKEKRSGTADLDGNKEKRSGTADLDGGQNRNAQQLTHVPNNGEQITVSFSSLTPGQGSVVIGVLDTGLDTAHPDISSKVWSDSDVAGNNDDQNCYINDINGYNFVDSTGNIYDDHGHGTHVGGVIAANVPEGVDIKVMPVKTFDNEGDGTMYNMLCGIYYAIDNGADIINISAGYAGDKSSVFQKTIQYGRENNVLFVVSAGNESIDLDDNKYWPASFSKDEILSNTMITVTSIDATYNLSSDAGYGDTTVTVAAQGEGIFSPSKDGGYAHFTGTSISTPLVALALGIEKTQNPNRDYNALRSDFLNGLNTISKLEDYVEKGRVLTIGISNLTNIIINPENVCVDTLAGTTAFSIYGDTDFEVSTDADWIETLSTQPANNGTILNIKYKKNNTTLSREAIIIITAGNRTYKGYLIQEGTAPDPIDLAINEAYLSGNIYKAASNITAAKVIGIDATVHYHAKNSIVMSDGFHAQSGSSFLASIGTCEQPDNKEEQIIPQISLKCYPNPFNAQTTIEYNLLEDSDITLIISDVAGRQVDVLINGEIKTAGTHKVVFDGSQLPSGMYYYTIKTGDYFGTQKMILAK